MATNNNPDRHQVGLSKSQQRRAREEAAKAVIAAQKRRQSMRRYGLIGGAVLALVVLLVVLVVVGKHHNSSTAAAAAEPTQYWLNVGSPNAPHKVTVYEDFLCPFCDHLELQSETQLQAEAKAGKVYISYRPFNLLGQDGPYSSRALNAFLAVKEVAGDEVALAYHNLLFHNQPAEPGPQDDDSAALIALANQVVGKADQSKVADAITNNTYNAAVGQVTDYVLNTVGVTSTPTVYFDDTVYSDTSGTHTDPTFGGVENMADNLIKAVQ